MGRRQRLHRAGILEVLVVIGVGTAGVVLAALLALAPWPSAGEWAYPHVVRLDVPAVTLGGFDPPYPSGWSGWIRQDR
jgi:hypothetical protein